MGRTTAFWLRREASHQERRTPLVPTDAAALVAGGVEVTVEESDHRAFPIAEYAAAGCRVVTGDTFPDAPADTVVLGLKEPAGSHALTHRHVYFGHAYLGQVTAPQVLRRFTTGGGVLLDLETLVDGRGRRITAFGHWAGYAGAALAILHHRGVLDTPLQAMSHAEVRALIAASRAGGETALVTGALGRAGRGAAEALESAGMVVTSWDVAETRALERETLLAHDILVNCVGVTAPGTPFVTVTDLDDPCRWLTTVADVTCDVTSPRNRIPVNDRATTWDEPARCFAGAPHQLDVIAIDNLPSLVPRESSEAFSADLAPLLRTLDDADDPVWARSRDRFDEAVARLDEGRR